MYILTHFGLQRSLKKIVLSIVDSRRWKDADSGVSSRNERVLNAFVKKHIKAPTLLHVLDIELMFSNGNFRRWDHNNSMICDGPPTDTACQRHKLANTWHRGLCHLHKRNKVIGCPQRRVDGSHVITTAAPKNENTMMPGILIPWKERTVQLLFEYF